MKKQHLLLSLIAFLLWISPPTVYGQNKSKPCNNFDCAYKKAENFLKQAAYQKALDNLDSAEGYLTDTNTKEKEQIKQLRRRLFVAIEKEKEDAKRARDEATKAKADAVNQEQNAVNQKLIAEEQKLIAQKQTDSTKIALQKADSLFKIAQKQTDSTKIALQKVDDLLNIAETQRKDLKYALDLIYFYDDYLGLAFDKLSQNFGFIDRDFNTKIKFLYSEAYPFNSLGYSRVRNGNNLFLIDTKGIEYSLKQTLYSAKFIGLNDLTKFLFSKILYEAIDLSNDGRRYFPYFMLPQKKTLKILLFDNNFIKKIPKKIIKLNNLEALSLSRNRIKKVNNNLCSLKNLENLNLSYNQISELPNCLCYLTSLKRLILRGNDISKLPTDVSKLSELKYLDCKNNPIALEEQERIKKLLPNCKIDF